MNKVLFQIGALAFFISAVVFSIRQYPLFDTVARAFIVFMTVELIGTAVLVLVTYVQSKQKTPSQAENQETPAHSPAQSK